MYTKIILGIATFFFAFFVLFISILRTAAVKYDFRNDTLALTGAKEVLGEDSVVDYRLAYPGKVLPDSPLWGLKAARDKVWYAITTNPTKEAEPLLLFADKRLASARILFERGNYADGYSTLIKAERYLEMAAKKEEENRANGYNTSEFLERLTLSSLKHCEVIRILEVTSPEEVRPMLVRLCDHSKRVYDSASEAMKQKGITPPEYPF
jgi:hypothetical protein